MNVNICNVAIIAIIGPIFMKFSLKCRAKKLGILYIILGRFCSFLNWEGADIWPQIWSRKIPGMYKSKNLSSYTGLIKFGS